MLLILTQNHTTMDAEEYSKQYEHTKKKVRRGDREGGREQLWSTLPNKYK